MKLLKLYRVRVDAQKRVKFLHREHQLKEFAVYLGKLTHAANNYPGPSGTLRDSDAKRIRSGKLRCAKRRVHRPKAVRKIHRQTSSVANRSVHGVSRGSRHVGDRASQVSKKSWMGKAKSAALEASFFQNWRDNRADWMKPSVGMLASQRTAELKQRLAARGAASGT